MTRTTPLVVHSAPGKALLAGGYLVLFPEYSAVSIGLSSRMYAAIFPSTDPLTIRSPQFESEWKYPGGTGTHHNPFLDACYEIVRVYTGRDLHGRIVIYSDSPFHSQDQVKPKYHLDRFSAYGRPITDVAKTGLGSSAALVVAVVAALARLASFEAPEWKHLTKSQLHNLAQIAHSVAQGKIGSGFDVATAVNGTIVYSTFPPGTIPANVKDREELTAAVNQDWDLTISPLQLPDFIQILMGDVNQGSETPGMVRSVLKWRENNPPDADALFAQLNAANRNLALLLAQSNPGAEELTCAIHDIRQNLRQLTKESGVPIEPPAQTELLDTASKVPGVLGGVVPGAGGNDAVCLVIDTRIAPLDSVVAQLQNMKGVTWMTDLKIEPYGLQEEEPELFAEEY